MGAHRGKRRAMNRLANQPFAPFVFFAVYALVWTVTATLSDSSFHFDIQEEIAWGREWLVGLYRHPPMKVWLLEIANQMTGFADFTPYLLSTALFGIGQIAIYLMLADVTSRRLAFFSSVSATSIYLFGPLLPLWNANTVQFAFVGLFLLSAWRALDRSSALWMIAAAVFAAGGVLGKYTFFGIVAPVGMWAILHPGLRRNMPWIGLLAGGLVFAALIAPTAHWLLTEGDEAFRFISERTSEAYAGIGGQFLAAGQVALVIVLLALAPVLFFVTGLRASHGVVPEDADRKRNLLQFLGAAAVGSHAVILGIVFANGTVIKDHWLMASLMTVPPFLCLLTYRNALDATLTRFGALIVPVWLAGLLAAYPLERYIKLETAEPERPFAWYPVMPSEPLIADAVEYWERTRSTFPDAGLPLAPAVVAGGYDAALIANQYPGRPAWLERFSTAKSPWVSGFDITGSGVLAIGRAPDDFLDQHKVCQAYTETVGWKNVRGQKARTITLSVLLPSASPDCAKNS
ncbi:MAG: glycosyltransferase family 39 protein [Pseudomonadota bacterium]